jgi:hypothetical protein
MPLAIVLAAMLWAFTPLAFAGHASTGELLFFPCTSCHPLSPGASTDALPNKFPGHKIVLESHDKLGKGEAACLVCHDDPSRDPGKLKLIDGSLVDVTGDVSLVCYRCHEAKYKEFKAGEHGRNMPKCTSSGCHDPHTPAYVYAGPVMPFTGTGFQVRAVSGRLPFLAMPMAPLPPPTTTPAWLLVAAVLGLVVAAGIVGALTLGRSTR